ncbi:MAG: hypothetical protein V4591_10905, partial [Bdellovibrionota bacterium]
MSTSPTLSFKRPPLSLQLPPLSCSAQRKLGSDSSNSPDSKRRKLENLFDSPSHDVLGSKEFRAESSNDSLELPFFLSIYSPATVSTASGEPLSPNLSSECSSSPVMPSLTISPSSMFIEKETAAEVMSKKNIERTPERCGTPPLNSRTFLDEGSFFAVYLEDDQDILCKVVKKQSGSIYDPSRKRATPFNSELIWEKQAEFYNLAREYDIPVLESSFAHEENEFII